MKHKIYIIWTTIFLFCYSIKINRDTCSPQYSSRSVHKYEFFSAAFLPFLLHTTFSIYILLQAFNLVFLFIISKDMSSVNLPIFSSDSIIIENDPFLALESNYFMQWDCLGFFPTTQSIGHAETPGSGASDHESKQNQTNSISNSNSCLSEPNQQVPIIDERKRRRMLSNRDSARRSRMRKRNHLDNLRNEVNQLRNQNQELNNQLSSVSQHYHRLRIENDRFRSEYSLLQQELLEMRQILVFKQQLSSSSNSCIARK